jgi:hypothetical protein
MHVTPQRLVRARNLCASTALLAVCAACTAHGYTKPDATEQGFATDQRECAEIARREAFADNNRDRMRAQATSTSRRTDAARDLYGTIPSLAELQSRYYHICMLARGYQRTPLEEGGQRDHAGDVD